MTYCRWSTDDLTCDLYCYGGPMRGYTTHVASMRIVGDAPKLPDPATTTPGSWMRARSQQLTWLETARRVPIRLAFAGQTLHDETLEAFRNRLILLRTTGYRFPATVLETVERELAVQAAVLAAMTAHASAPPSTAPRPPDETSMAPQRPADGRPDQPGAAP